MRCYNIVKILTFDKTVISLFVHILSVKSLKFMRIIAAVPDISKAHIFLACTRSRSTEQNSKEREQQYNRVSYSIRLAEFA